MRELVRIAWLYAVFAALATAANLAAQALSLEVYRGARAIPLSVLVGTAVGLALKYLLDKRFIFAFRADSLAHDGWLFTLYTGMGVVTTAIFWGVEYAFHVLFATDAMRYLGGALGLGLGYVIKYRLDKRFVFVRRTAGAAGMDR